MEYVYLEHYVLHEIEIVTSIPLTKFLIMQQQLKVFVNLYLLFASVYLDYDKNFIH